MNMLEAVYSGKDFKYGDNRDWLYVYETGLICYRSTIIPAQFLKEEVLGDKWIIKEEWYEGDFKKKYPHGVFCEVKPVYSSHPLTVTIIDYHKGKAFPFRARGGGWLNAKPIPPEKAPAIIGKEDKNDKC